MQRWLRQRCRAVCRPAPAAPGRRQGCAAAAGATTAWPPLPPLRPPPPPPGRPPPQLRTQLLQLLQVLAVLAVAALLPGCSGGPRYSSRIVQTKYGSVRGVIVQLNSRRLEPVEVFRGVPYAAPPTGPLRLAPSQPPPPWTGTRLADSFGPVCPQRMPVADLGNRTSALQAMPRGRLLHLKHLAPFLTRQSEDCLNLNLYVPGSGSRGADAPYPIVVFIHGESYEWNAGSPYDGSVLASWGHVITVTFNYRLGILGFLRTRLGSQDLDFGTGDILAALRWVQDNAAAFGGDPRRVTLLGHDTGAALASILLLNPLSKGLFHHVVLMSGSVLSPWATVQSPWELRGTVSHQMGCHVSAPGDQDLAPCLRRLPLEALLSVSVEPPRFLPRFGPSIPYPGLDPVRVALEKATDPFVRCPLLMGAHTTESYDDFSNQDIQYGFEEEQRNRVLRTFVRNAYVFHLNEIFSTVRNEYTDWEKPVAHPINLRDNTLEALSDGHTVAPLVQLARSHARRGAPTYLFHFAHQTRDSLYPQRLGSVRGEGLPYLLGLPLVGGEPHFPHNYSRQDVAVAEATINYICNFAKTGNPNDPRAEQQASSHKWEEDRETRSRFKDIVWEKYEMSTQLYLSITQKPRMKSHYRGHRIAVWLDLIPQLHRAGGQDVAMRHHHFHEKGERYFSGSVRPETSTQVPAVPDFLVPPTSSSSAGAAGATTGTAGHECPPAANLTELAVVEENAENDVAGGGRGPSGVEVIAGNSLDHNVDDENGFLHGFTPSQFFKSSLALGVTLGAGGLLLVLNVVVLVAILYQRARKARQARRKQDASPGGGSAGSAGSAGSSSAAASSQEEGLGGLGLGPGSAELLGNALGNATPLTALGVTTLPRAHKQNGPLDVLQVVGVAGVPPRYSGVSAIPAPPPPRAICPPPIVVPPPVLGTNASATVPRPAAPKKRVQIQEISV